MTPFGSTPSIALLGATLMVPLLLAALLVLPAFTRRSWCLDLAAFAALPACLAVIWLPDGYVVLDWVLLGSRLGLDPTGRVFLGLTAFLWLSAGVFARGYLRDDPRAPRFFGFFLLSMAGNLGLVLAQDAVTFFAFFTLMSLAAYGLVVHDPTPANLRAGRVYIVLALLGEALLFSALALLAPAPEPLTFPLAGVAAEGGPLLLCLLLLGFGIKAGALPVHVWLPLAHPAAPTPASAVLSGAMIKAGLLGWLRFLPLGEVGLPHVGAMVAGAGVLAAYYGVAVGVLQHNPKTVLAYSSISQMGFVTVAVGVGLAVPAAWPALLLATLAYAVHHGLAKSALFMGVGIAAHNVRRRIPVLCGMGLAALALAGAPFTSGALAKASLKAALADTPGAPALLAGALTLAAVGTTLLMARVLVLVMRGTAPRDEPGGGWMWLAGAASVVAVAGGAMLVPGTAPVPIDLDGTAAAAWPVLSGAVLALALWYFSPRLPAWLAVPAGDLLVPVAALASQVGDACRAQARRAGEEALRLRRRLVDAAPVPSRERLSAIEQALSEWPVVGLCLLGLLLALLALLA